MFDAEVSFHFLAHMNKFTEKDGATQLYEGLST